MGALAIAMAMLGAGMPIARAEAPEVPLEDASARTRLEEGLEHYEAHRFEDAARAFADAYAIEPAPFLLYSWAQAERHAGDCGRAIELFERFLATAPPEDQARRARAKIVECDGIPPPEVAPPPEVEPNPPTAPPPPTTPVLDPDVETGRDRESISPLALGLGVSALVVGAALGSSGAILVDSGGERRRDAPGASDQQSFLDEREAGERRQRIGWTLVGVGGAFVVAGVATLVASSVRARRRGPAVTRLRPRLGGLAVAF